MDPAEALRTEVERLHAFISGWFRGEIVHDAFEAGFTDRMHPEFENIQPSGRVLKRADLIDPIRAAHGSNPDFRITIREPRVLGTWPGLILGTYVEEQSGARNTDPPDNDRRSTALFLSDGPHLIWRHLQETAVPK